VKFSLLLVIFLIGASLRAERVYSDHDLHASVTEVKWNAESTSFEVSIKIFIDDLEASLSRDNISGLNIGTEKESAGANDIITGYLDKHFKISLDGIQLPSQFVGKETTDDFKAIWCYVEYPGLKDPKKCLVSNDILFELYDDQRSIMDIRMNSTDKTYIILEPGQSTWSYTF
jgi:hypothetical protein